jgi:glycosyltransferase involved in cell wall biosynthesis
MSSLLSLFPKRMNEPIPAVLPISVVIATLGGAALEQTLAGLLAGSSRPAEILVCIPEFVRPQARLADDGIVRIIRTAFRGQVAQRAAGLVLAREDHVLQLDDDMVVPNDGLENLWRLSLAAGAGTAVAPALTDSATGQYLASYGRDWCALARSLAAWIMGGARWGVGRMGTIGSAAIPYGVDPRHAAGAALLETQWLAGGAVICRREDLVTESYFPFQGKAYSEDVIHSILWKRRGVRLYVAPGVTFGTAIEPAGPASFAQLAAERRARAHAIRLMGGSTVRGWLWFACSLARWVVSQLTPR